MTIRSLEFMFVLVFPLYKPVFERFRHLLAEIGPMHTPATLKSTIGVMHLLGVAIPSSDSSLDETQARMLNGVKFYNQLCSSFGIGENRGRKSAR